MEKVVEQVKFRSRMPRPERVAAYARVSSGKEAMLHSLAAQVDYYSTYIRHHPGWEYVGVYTDEAKTGTKDSREGFQRLLADCKSGKVNHIITKSVSRFARNTVTLLETVRELKNMGISVYFEEQNINTMTADGELMLTILASYAQAESLSASENQKWRVRQNFEEGKPWRGYMLGYRYKDGEYVIVPEEAEIVKRIYADFLSGKGIEAIMKSLNESGVLTQQGFNWHRSAVMRILRNYTYTGNLLLQTKYRENHLTKKTLVNHGELPQYHATDSHEAIIDMETFEEVQAEIARRAKKYTKPHKRKEYPFSGIMTCAICGKHYRRKTTPTGPVWICSTYNTSGKKACASKAIPEPTLIVLAKKNAHRGQITAVTVAPENHLTFRFADGSECEEVWQDRSRSESWTADMRAAVAKKTKERIQKNG